MLKEAVDLLAKASRANQALYTLDTSSDHEGPWEDCKEAIGKLTDAIGRHDESKKNTDAAINLLFRAVVVAENNPDDADELVERAEKLLGFVPLKPV